MKHRKVNAQKDIVKHAYDLKLQKPFKTVFAVVCLRLFFFLLSLRNCSCAGYITNTMIHNEKAGFVFHVLIRKEQVEIRLNASFAIILCSLLLLVNKVFVSCTSAYVLHKRF